MQHQSRQPGHHLGVFTGSKVWRYAHYHSYTPWAAKRSILVSTLKKVDKMASDGDSLVSSALWKLAEFAKLRYPIQALLRACTLVAVTTRNATIVHGLRFAVLSRSTLTDTYHPRVMAMDARVSWPTKILNTRCYLRSEGRCSVYGSRIGDGSHNDTLVVDSSRDCPPKGGLTRS